MAVSKARCLGVVVLSVTLAACTQGPRHADKALPSLAVRDVFFTNTLVPSGRTYRAAHELGPRLRTFDPDRDDIVVLIIVCDRRYDVNARVALLRPDGQQHGMFVQRLDAEPRGGWHTIRRYWSIDRLRPWRGEWRVKLWIDEQPLGDYYFVLAASSGRGIEATP
jgi:hypothetical protein